MSRPPRAVFDTSTLIGALLGPRSVPRQALTLALPSFELCVCEATLTELDKVMRRTKFDKYLSLTERLDFVALYQRRSSMHSVDRSSELIARDVCRDPEDAKFLALAHACSAEVLVSSDEDLLVLNGWQGIGIVRASQFVDALNGVSGTGYADR